eukprot:359163-Rhodomonas_salina.2
MAAMVFTEEVGASHSGSRGALSCTSGANEPETSARGGRRGVPEGCCKRLSPPQWQSASGYSFPSHSFKLRDLELW